MSRPRFFCFGLGYSASVLARRLKAEGWDVAGTCRGEAARARLAAEGFDAVCFERDHRIDPALLAGATHVLVSVPPDENGDAVIDEHGSDIAALAGLRWLGYLSTTGVYGDYRGAWVDETSPLRPTLERSWRRLYAEQDWLDLWRRHRVPVHLFRLAGIYGPGRSAIDSARSGKAHRVVKRGHVACRIHVDDLAQVLRASMDRPDPGAVYNVADDLPAPTHEVVAFACELIGAPMPPLEPYEFTSLSEMARSFYLDSRRVRNDLIKRALGVRLAYPDYRQGLRAVLAAETGASRRKP